MKRRLPGAASSERPFLATRPATSHAAEFCSVRPPASGNLALTARTWAFQTAWHSSKDKEVLRVGSNSRERVYFE
jgi:hypothetical protein